MGGARTWRGSSIWIHPSVAKPSLARFAIYQSVRREISPGMVNSIRRSDHIYYALIKFAMPEGPAWTWRGSSIWMQPRVAKPSRARAPSSEDLSFSSRCPGQANPQTRYKAIVDAGPRYTYKMRWYKLRF